MGLSPREEYVYLFGLSEFFRENYVGHPAPFPVELPCRLIQLYTFRDEVVSDLFCGGGSTCLAAIKTGRHYIGYDIEEEYVRLAERSI